MSIITCPNCGGPAIMGIGEPPDWIRAISCMSCQLQGSHKMRVGADGKPTLRDWLTRPAPVAKKPEDKLN